ncbi:PstS family phosphate ABC transporter substrate-binding protein [Halostagnicola kamekurae]|uniref:Phosphate ABC transporter substrate-binding protein, PhoT family n=1 Tax=Halostagnicola kamekurae TaxID=619731 RepID=A0A1I6U2W8_9EURY|nr:substrate-binding domain-containing protein [Halostagnicola kamekurae]SFS95765.1 phosphate ABC transporter substrate-binding protein, PhoT family [Halostagnicola kamekurae]
MAHDSDRLSKVVSRRNFVLASGAAGVATLAGCSSQSDEETGNTSSNSDIAPLTADGSSTVFPITNGAARLWNGNPPADDQEYWGPGQYDIDTDQNLADYWAGMYGFEPTEERSVPPFNAQVALSHSGTGVEAVTSGRVDIGDASSTAESILGSDHEELENIVDHVVGVDGQPIVVSREIRDAGVSQITGDELRAIYKQEITNWSEVGGPDQEIYAIGRAEDSGTDTAFRSNLYGDPEAPIEPDTRRGQNQQVVNQVEQTDNAIAYIALAFVEPDGATPPIGLELDGTLYEYGENLGAKEYPLSRDLHCYTYDGTDDRESAFINMILSEFGQQNFVEPNNYFKLPEARREEERSKLADQS